jgi:hypothetical protein
MPARVALRGNGRIRDIITGYKGGCEGYNKAYIEEQ